MQRETLKAVRDALDKLDCSQFLAPLPHGHAVLISDTCREAIDIILGEEFAGAEILGDCGFCEKLLFVEDEGIFSDEDGGHYCADCGKAEMEAQANTCREAIDIILDGEFSGAEIQAAKEPPNTEEIHVLKEKTP